MGKYYYLILPDVQKYISLLENINFRLDIKRVYYLT